MSAKLFNIKDVRINYYWEDILDGKFWPSKNVSQLPGIPILLPFEEHVIDNTEDLINFCKRHWHYSFYISIGYIITIFTLKYIMSKKEKGFDLKRELIWWNWFLAIFSFLGTVRCLPEFIHVLKHDGFVASYTQSTYVKDGRVNTWYLLFILSKAPELVDTLFIVLRKRRLIQLHWIHHTLTLIYSWLAFTDMPGTARWMVNMNLFIHTFMYSYYALSAMGYRFPKQVNVTLTTLQIVQMLFGFYIHIDCLRLKLSSQPCDISLAVSICGFSLYFLFFLLFCNFFIQTYIIPSSKAAVKVAVNGVKENGKAILNDLNNNVNNGKEVVKKLQ